MGRAPCCDKDKVKRGPWAPEEDETLKNYLHNNGFGGNWITLPNKAGLNRCGKSCRLRWLNYLRPNIKHGHFTPEEDAIILELYTKMGSRWSVIASKLPGRTDNDVKNHWNTKLKKKLMAAQQQQHLHQPSIPTPSSAYLFPKIQTYNPKNSTISYNAQQIIMQPLVDVNYGGQINPNNNTINQEGLSISDSTGFSNDFMGNYVWNYQDYEAFFEEVVDPVLNDPTNSFVNSAMCQNVTNIFY